MTATSGTGGKMKDSAAAVAATLKLKSVTTPLDKKEAKKLRSYENRKIRKPLMEKRRRARINQSLNELKKILLQANTSGAAVAATATRKEGSRPAKLEKADILENSLALVRHLLALQNSSSEGVNNTNGNNIQEKQPSGSSAPRSVNTGGKNNISEEDEADMMITEESRLTAPSNNIQEPCHVIKVSSSTSSASSSSDSDDERTSSPTPSFTPDQSENCKTRSSKFCCAHEVNNAKKDSTFINGFTECLRLVRTSLKAQTLPNPIPNREIPSNLEETLESYLSELQQQQHNQHANNNGTHFGKLYYQNSAFDYSPQHSPADSISSAGTAEYLQMTLNMEEGKKSHKFHSHQPINNNYFPPAVEPPMASSSPVLISSTSSNSPSKFLYRNVKERKSQNKCFPQTGFVLKSDNNKNNDPLMMENDGFNENYGFHSDHLHDYQFSHFHRHQQGQFNQQVGPQHQVASVVQIEESQAKFPFYHCKYFGIESPRVVWRPW